MSLVQTLVAFLIALGVLILFHELGHYWIARLCGVKVLRFSIGFGRPLAVHRSRGPDRTEWVLAALPLGGYVKMLDEREGPVDPLEADRAFNRQNVWKRVAIVAAGPIANFLLAIVLYAGLFMHGVSEPRPILAGPEAETAAAVAGIQDGDVVQSVNATPVRTWSALRWSLLDLAIARGTAALEVVDAHDNLVTRRLDLSGARIDDMEGDPLARLGLKLYRPAAPAVIGPTEPNGVARAAGLGEGDRIVTVDGRTISTFDELVRAVVASPGTTLELEVQRANGEQGRVRVTPRAVERDGRTIGRIGAGPRIDRERFEELVVDERYGPVEAFAKAGAKTWEMSVFSLRMLGKMITGDVSWRNLSGPVTIADYAGQSAALGVLPYLTFLALVSISLGVLNLLPIPILDGGHLLYYALEIVKGRPLSDRAMEFGQRVGLAILLGLMAFAFYNDINRLLSG